MATIALSNHGIALVDDEDFSWVSQWRWHCEKAKAGKGYARRSIYKQGRIVGLPMHRAILQYHGHSLDGLLVDHINRDTLDNHKANLRIATPTGNARNRQKSAKTQNPFKGVSWMSRKQRWRAQIRLGNTWIFLGYFGTALEAAQAYNLKALELFGPYAALNQLD